MVLPNCGKKNPKKNTILVTIYFFSLPGSAYIEKSGRKKKPSTGNLTNIYLPHIFREIVNEVEKQAFILGILTLSLFTVFIRTFGESSTYKNNQYKFN